MIVSGSYFIGWFPFYYQRKRKERIQEILNIFIDFLQALRNRRASVTDVLATKGVLGNALLKNETIEELTQEDTNKINEALGQLKSCAYQDSILITESIIEYLENVESKLSNEEKTTGRAFPLVMGLLGFLVVVLLF